MIDNKVFLYKQIIQEERDITNKKKQLKDEFSKYIRNYEKNKDSSLYRNRKNKQSVTGKVGENIIHSYNLSRSLPINKRIYKSIITEEESNQDDPYERYLSVMMTPKNNKSKVQNNNVFKGLNNIIETSKSYDYNLNKYNGDILRRNNEMLKSYQKLRNNNRYLYLI